MDPDLQPTAPGPGPDPQEDATAWLPPEQRATVGLPKGGAAEAVPEVPGYEVLRTLGRGGMGVVYLARDLRLERLVALKRVIFQDPELARRLVHEARSQARIEHPHICKVFEAGESGGIPYIAMQFIEGRPLDEMARDLPLETRVSLLVEVAEAIHAAHKQGLIHRDLKPANILVATAEDGRPWPFVMDFGLAQDQSGSRLTQMGAIMGTPAYMSPEQARGDVAALDRRTDVYALGATLYELIAGHPPFEGSSGADTLLRVIQEEPTPLRRLAASTPEDLEVITLKCLEKEPGRRYDSAKALAEDLRAWLDGEPIRARKTGLAERLLKKARKHRLAVAFSAVALAGVVTGLGIWIRTRAQASEAAALNREFGAEMERWDSVLRFGHLLPPHPIQREERLARQGLDTLRNRLRTLKGPSAAVAHFALGRALSLLGRGEEARPELEKARDLGLKDPKLDGALASVWLQAAVEARARALNLPTAEAREAARRKVAQDLIEPARRLAPADPLVLAHLALAEGRWEDARRLARGVLADAPWRYESLVLVAESERREGSEQIKSGRFTEGLPHLDKALEALAEARRLAPSDPAIPTLEAVVCSLGDDIQYQRALAPEPKWMAGQAEALARLKVLQPESQAPLVTEAKMKLQGILHAMDQGRLPMEALAEVRELLHAALRLAPDDIEASFMLGNALYLEVNDRLPRGEPVEGRMQELQALLDKALAATPNQPDFLLQAAALHRLKAQLLRQRGGDPKPELDRAVGLSRQCLGTHPEHLQAYGALAGDLVQLANEDQLRGVDPQPRWKEAIQLTEEVQRRSPEEVAHFDTLGYLHLQMMLWALNHGGDVEAEASLCRTSYDAYLRLLPKALAPRQALGWVEMNLAALAMQWGRSPVEHARAGRIRFEILVKENPQDLTDWQNLAAADQLLAREALARGADPTADLDRSDASLRHAEAPSHLADTRQAQGENELIRAAWLLSRGRPAAAALDRAEARLREAQPLSSSPAMIQQRLGEVALLRAQQGQDASRKLPLLAQAEDRMKAALAVDGRSAEAWGLMAEIHRRWAEATAEGRAEQIRKGQGAAAKALEQHPRWAPALAERAMLEALGAPGDAKARQDLRTALEWQPTLAARYRLP